MRSVRALSTIVMVLAGIGTIGAAGSRSTLVVTSSNTTANELLVFDAAGVLTQAVPTGGDGGGIHDNAGGIAADGNLVAVVNFGSSTVTTFVREGDAFLWRESIPTLSAPVSVVFGKDHLYVLGTSTVESHRTSGDDVDPAPDGSATLTIGDGSAAQVGVTGEALVVTEKSGAVERVALSGSAVAGTTTALALPPQGSDTPFGLATRGSAAYVTIAHSDLVGLLRNGRFTSVVATGQQFPSGPGEHAPCWIAASGPYLFTANSPSHSISRILAAGSLALDAPAAARLDGAPTDIAARQEWLAVLETVATGTQLTQFEIDDRGALTVVAKTPIPSAANGLAIVGR
jgi:hypothetical protein